MLFCCCQYGSSSEQNTDCVEDFSSRDYTGTRSITASGRVCQRWNSQLPHAHNINVDDLPDASLGDAANFCRNPDGRSTGPWCYTLDVDLVTETCGIPLCTGKVFVKLNGYSIFLYIINGRLKVFREMCNCHLYTDCRMTYHGYDYQGQRSTTISGRPCQRWDEQVTNCLFTDTSNHK